MKNAPFLLLDSSTYNFDSKTLNIMDVLKFVIIQEFFLLTPAFASLNNKFHKRALTLFGLTHPLVSISNCKKASLYPNKTMPIKHLIC